MKFCISKTLYFKKFPTYFGNDQQNSLAKYEYNLSFHRKNIFK